MGGGLYIPKNGILSKFNLRVRGELRNLLKIRLLRLFGVLEHLIAESLWIIRGRIAASFARNPVIHVPESSELQRSAASKKLVTLDWYGDFAMICASPCPEPGTSQSCFGSRAA